MIWSSLDLHQSLSDESRNNEGSYTTHIVAYCTCKSGRVYVDYVKKTLAQLVTKIAPIEDD